MELEIFRELPYDIKLHIRDFWIHQTVRDKAKLKRKLNKEVIEITNKILKFYDDHASNNWYINDVNKLHAYFRGIIRHAVPYKVGFRDKTQ